MSFRFYPTTALNDYDQSLVAECKTLLLKPLSEIFDMCYNYLGNQKKFELSCILRCVLEKPITPDYASLIGWFAVNNLIPQPTLLLYMNELLSKKDTYFGEQCCMGMAQEILLFGYRFPSFLESVAIIPGFLYRHPDLFIAINQVLETNVPIDSYVSRNHFSIPTPPRPFQIPIRPQIQLKSITRSPNEPPLKSTLEECVQQAYLMQEEHRRHYLISYVLNSQIPDHLRDSPKVLLEAVCVYAKHLISNSSSDGRGVVRWDRCSYHMQLHQIGIWIGLLSISRGPPPPLYYIDMHKILKESVHIGCFMEAVILLTGYFSRANQIYQLPCPYTTGILEIMAAVVNNSGIRLDVRQAVDNFANIFGTSIQFFYNRTMEVDPMSFDMHAVFQQNPQTNETFLAPYSRNSILCTDANKVYNFFNYLPDVTKFPQNLVEMLEKAEYIRKYYFVGKACAYNIPQFDATIPKLTNMIFSLAMAANPVLSKSASKILKKLLQINPMAPDMNRLRYAFPNQNILSALVDTRNVDFTAINSLLSDILASPETGPTAYQLIQRMMPLIFKINRIHPEINFTSLYMLTGMQPPHDDQHLPTPDHSHIPLLRYFIQYCKVGDETSKQEFIAKFVPGSPAQVTSLIQLILASVGDSSRDYTAIDCYASVIPSLPSKILTEALLPGLFKAFELLPPAVVVSHQRAVFRITWETLTALEDLHPQRLLSFFMHYGPGAIPGFTCSWMQLVLHPKVLPVLIDNADPTSVHFTLRFIVCIIKLAVNVPDVFYLPTVRILYTLADSFPAFLVSYHCLILEHVPPRATQIRNIILNATIHGGQKVPPPIGITFGSSPEMKILKSKLEPFIFDKVAVNLEESVMEVCEIVKTMASTDPSILWRVIYFLIAYYVSKHENFNATAHILEVFIGLIRTSTIFLTMLMDHVRYKNSHTIFVMNVLVAIFPRIGENLQEQMIIEMIRRLLCVCKPPISLVEVFNHMWANFKSEILKVANKSVSIDEFTKIAKIILGPNA